MLSLNPDLVASVIISIISPIIGTSTTRMRTIYCVIIITIIQLQSYDKYTTICKKENEQLRHLLYNTNLYTKDSLNSLYICRGF